MTSGLLPFARGKTRPCALVCFEITNPPGWISSYGDSKLSLAQVLVVHREGGMRAGRSGRTSRAGQSLVG